MIQKVDLEDSSGIGNAAGQARIGFRGAWVTGGMMMHQGQIRKQNEKRRLFGVMRKSLFLAVVLANCVMVCSVRAIGLFRYRNRAEDGRKWEYAFETDQQGASKL